MDLELQGKVAVVTGGSRGIGKAIAQELAMEGSDVVISARGEKDLASAGEELSRETGRRVVAIACDVRSSEQVDRLFRTTVETFGHVDILVNNAGQPGGLAKGPLASVSIESVLEDLDVKYLGALRCARSAATYMQRQGWGRIISIGGLSARQSGSYSAGTRNIAIVHLTKTLADELGPSGITANVVHPGPTKTPWIKQNYEARAKQEGVAPEEIERQIAQQHAIRRIVEAREIAYIVAFLASTKAAAITGESIGAGGGTSRAVFL